MTRNARSRRLVRFVPRDLQQVSRLEERSLTAPIFNRNPGTLIFGSVGTSASATDPTNVLVSYTLNQTLPVAQGPGSSVATSVVASGIDTATGLSGASGITVSAQHAGTIDAEVSSSATGSLLGVGTGSNVSTVDASGNPAAATWATSDSTPTNSSDDYVTLTFEIYGTDGINTATTNVNVMGQATLSLVTNQISVQMNTPNNSGLRIYNLASGPFGSFFPVVSLPNYGLFQYNPGTMPYHPSESAFFAYEYQTRVPISLPGTESIQFSSSMNLYANAGLSPGKTFHAQPQVHWTLTISNN